MSIPIAGTGTLSQATTSASAKTVTVLGSAGPFSRLEVINTGTGDGFISLDNGNTWLYIPTASVLPRVVREIVVSDLSQILIKRAASTDLSGVYISFY